jgi:hypothetical protein
MMQQHNNDSCSEDSGGGRRHHGERAEFKEQENIEVKKEDTKHSTSRAGDGTFEGPLFKQGGGGMHSFVLGNRKWKERWFECRPGLLLYRRSEGATKVAKMIRLCGVRCEKVDGSTNKFSVVTSGRTFELSAANQKQRDEWMRHISVSARCSYDT